MRALFLLSLTACFGVEPGKLGESFRLPVGETSSVAGAGMSVTFEEVRSDSRCPKEVQCIQAGEAIVVLSLKTSDGKVTRLTFEVPPGGGVKRPFADYSIQIVALEPDTEADRPIEPHAYVAQLLVESR